MRSSLSSSFDQAAGFKRKDRDAPTRPFSIRLSASERRLLEDAAGSTPLGTYVRRKLIGTAPPRRGRRRRTADTALLGQVLGALGASGALSGLKDIGIAARAGTVALTPELTEKIASACADIQALRSLLLQALGLPRQAGR